MTSLPPPGWYLDPLSRFDHRYWNGTRWTEHVSRDGQQYVDPLPSVGQVRAEKSDVIAAGPADEYVVVDVETTGLSANQHRVLELAVVRTDSSGGVVSEWVKRFNPDGPVGATHIHGITDADVADAPRFADHIPELNGLLAGGPVVAHNARFDLAFLRSEYRYAGWSLPWIPSLCTLDASDFYFPSLDRRRLSDCCAAARVSHRNAHSALHDARAVAGLLAHYLDAGKNPAPRPADIDICMVAATVEWPTAATRRPQKPGERARVSTRIEAKKSVEPAPNLVELLAEFSLVDALDEGAPAGSLAYLEKLAEVLEDGEISVEEMLALDEISVAYDMSDGDRTSANGGLLLALCHLALDDGIVSRAERQELKTVAALLNLPESIITDTLKWAEEARHSRLGVGLKALPDDWSLGEPLRVGDKVAFTGCDEQLRADLEKRAQEFGVRVMNNVSRKTAMLITDSEFVGTKAEAAAQLGTRIVHPDEFGTLLEFLQKADRVARGKHAG